MNSRPTFLRTCFFLALLFLPVDGFYAGIQILREFGARVTNFIIPFFIFYFFTQKAFSQTYSSFSFPNKFKVYFFSIIALVTFNFLVPLFNVPPTTLGRSPIAQWFLQYMIFIWFFVSIYGWVCLFEKLKIWNEHYQWFFKIITLTTIINLCFFAYDLLFIIITGSADTSFSLLFFLRGKLDPRASGLSTEPSLYASWVMFIWPLLFFSDKTRLNDKPSWIFRGKALALVSIASAILSGARTFIFIFALQLLIWFWISYAKQKLFRWIALLSILGLTTLLLIKGALPENILSIFSFSESEDYSSMNRLGTALTALLVFFDNPIFGIGLGQFSAYYAKYVPTWVLASQEAQNYFSGAIEQRVNTFNLMTRIGAELGIISVILFTLFFFFSFKVLYSQTMRYRLENAPSVRITMGVFISFIGGIGWWFSQDLFSYQPGIFSIATSIFFYKQFQTQPQFLRTRTRGLR